MENRFSFLNRVSWYKLELGELVEMEKGVSFQIHNNSEPTALHKRDNNSKTTTVYVWFGFMQIALTLQIFYRNTSGKMLLGSTWTYSRMNFRSMPTATWIPTVVLKTGWTR